MQLPIFPTRARRPGAFSLRFPRSGRWLAALIVGALAIVAVAVPAVAKNRFALEPPEVERTAAYRYIEPVKQVDTPVRLTGPVRGVEFALTYRAPPDVAEPKAAIADCRLAIALDDLAAVVAEHGITKVEYLSMYRTRGVGWVKPGRRHPAALAIDIAVLHRNDGQSFSVLRDWQGVPGAKTCGEHAAKPRKDTEGARLLRDIVCELDRKKSFNLLLTPHYDWGHRDHFHFEVRQGIRWYLTQ
jgi:hypothetical protein